MRNSDSNLNFTQNYRYNGDFARSLLKTIFSGSQKNNVSYVIFTYHYNANSYEIAYYGHIVCGNVEKASIFSHRALQRTKVLIHP